MVRRNHIRTYYYDRLEALNRLNEIDNVLVVCLWVIP